MRIALIVGINHYDHGGSLFGCVDDAHAVKAVLERHGDGAVNFTSWLQRILRPLLRPSLVPRGGTPRREPVAHHKDAHAQDEPRDGAPSLGREKRLQTPPLERMFSDGPILQSQGKPCKARQIRVG